MTNERSSRNATINIKCEKDRCRGKNTSANTGSVNAERASSMSVHSKVGVVLLRERESWSCMCARVRVCKCTCVQCMYCSKVSIFRSKVGFRGHHRVAAAASPGAAMSASSTRMKSGLPEGNS